MSEVVETAQKELKIENKLQVIDTAWSKLVLDYVPHKVCMCETLPLLFETLRPCLYLCQTDLRV